MMVQGWAAGSLGKRVHLYPTLIKAQKALPSVN